MCEFSRNRRNGAAVLRFAAAAWRGAARLTVCKEVPTSWIAVESRPRCVLLREYRFARFLFFSIVHIHSYYLFFRLGHGSILPRHILLQTYTITNTLYTQAFSAPARTLTYTLIYIYIHIGRFIHKHSRNSPVSPFPTILLTDYLPILSRCPAIPVSTGTSDRKGTNSSRNGSNDCDQHERNNLKKNRKR